MLRDKELDEIFRQGFEGAEFPVNPEAWAKAQELIQQQDPLALDTFVKGKFAQASFPMQQSSWLKAEAMIRSAYRGIFFRNVLAGAAIVITLSGALWYMTGRNGRSNTLETIEQPVVIEEYAAPGIEENGAAESEAPNAAMGNENASYSTKGGETLTYSGAKAPKQNSTKSSPALGNQTPEENAPQMVYNRAPYMPEIIPSSMSRERVDEIHLIKFEEEEEEKAKADASASHCLPGTSHYIGVMMGVAGSNILKGESPESGMSSSPVIGLRYALMLQKRWTINANILYNHRAGTNQSIVYESYEYNFGMDTITNYLTPTRLHYLELPVYASYQIGRDHKLSLGGYASWLMTINSYKDVYIKSAMNTQEHYETQEFGMVEALRQWDYGIMAGYEYRLHENLQVGLRFQYGLSDLTKEGYFQTEQNDHMWWLKLILEYRLSR